MLIFIITIVILFLLGFIVLQFIIFTLMWKNQKKLTILKDHYKNAFDNATTEITRLSLQLLKLKRGNVLQNNIPIVLELNTILERITKIGYDKLTQEEKDYLNQLK